MLTTTLAPRVQTEPAIKAPAVDDVTVIMPFYDRIKYLSHYLKEGFWEGLKLQVVCDGPAPNLLEGIQNLVKRQENIALYSYSQNRGAAFARTKGISLAKTKCLSFCDDDDFMSEATPFLTRSSEKLESNKNILFTTMPSVVAFNESLKHQLQYDRTKFHGKTGRELLSFLVKTGEMCALSVGSVFRTADVKGIYPDSFFKVSEDYTFLARLCARFPDRTVHVEEKGMYMRLIQEGSLSSKEAYSLEKIMMHLVSMFVGAYHLFKMSTLRTQMFQHILKERGKVLNKSYGKGTEAAIMLAGMLEGKSGPHQNDEQRTAYKFLQNMKDQLPPEFLWLVGWNIKRPYKNSDWNSI